MAKRKSPTHSAPSNGPRDYVAIADAYAREAVADKKGAKFGKWIRLAAKRYIDDLKRAGPQGPFTFTCPCTIRSSQARRLAIPAAASAFCSRCGSVLEFKVTVRIR